MGEFVCEHCEYKTAQPGSLKLHLNNIHYKIKHLACGQCPYTTVYTGNLRKHVKVHHEKNVDTPLQLIKKGTIDMPLANKNVKDEGNSGEESDAESIVISEGDADQGSDAAYEGSHDKNNAYESLARCIGEVNDDDDDDDDTNDDDDELVYEGNTQELLANVDCLLTTDAPPDGGNGSQDTKKSGSDHEDSYTINLSTEDKLWAEQAKERVLEHAEGKNITATEMRRRQISELLDVGITPSKVGAIMDCGPRTIFKIVKMKKAGESLVPKFSGNSGRPRSARTKDFVARAAAIHAANPAVSIS